MFAASYWRLLSGYGSSSASREAHRCKSCSTTATPASSLCWRVVSLSNSSFFAVSAIWVICSVTEAIDCSQGGMGGSHGSEVESDTCGHHHSRGITINVLHVSIHVPHARACWHVCLGNTVECRHLSMRTSFWHVCMHKCMHLVTLSRCLARRAPLHVYFE